MRLRHFTWGMFCATLILLVSCEHQAKRRATGTVTNIPTTTAATDVVEHLEQPASPRVAGAPAPSVQPEKTNVVELTVAPVAAAKTTDKVSYTIGVREAKLEGLMLLTSSHGTPEQPVATWGPRDQDKFATFTVTSLEGGPYVLWITLASGGYHPLDVFVNDVHVLTNVCGENTGGYDVAFARRLRAGDVQLAQGTNTIRLRVSGSSPCIASITLER